MKRFCLLFFILFATNFVIFSQNLSNSFIENQNKIAFDLYKKLITEKKNELFSPFFLNISFSQAYLATKSKTQVSISEYFNYDKNIQNHINEMVLYQKIVSENKNLKNNFQYSVDFYFNDTLVLVKKYLENIKNYIGDTVIKVDFTQKPDVIAKIFNANIKKNSNNFIDNQFKSSNIPSSPNVILNSSAYFSGDFAKNFTNYYISDFQLDSNENAVTETKFLTSFDVYNYGEAENYQIIEIPYEGYKFSLILILPNSTYNLKQFEEIITYKSYLLWRQKNMQMQNVRVFIPEFTVNSFFDIKKLLEKDYELFFKKGADFTNLVKRMINIDGFFHSTKLVFKSENNNLPLLEQFDFEIEKTQNESFIFNLNRPFITLLIHKETESIIYIGHIYNPNLQ